MKRDKKEKKLRELGKKELRRVRGGDARAKLVGDDCGGRCRPSEPIGDPWRG